MLKRDKDRRNVTSEPTLAGPGLSAAPSIKTVIGRNISVKGDISGDEDLVIEGVVQGSIELREYHLTVGPNGKVEAEINADNVTISGKLSGNITAKGKVEITKEADFRGEIKASRISVEDGAYLKAVIELTREDKKDSAHGKAAAAMPLSAAGSKEGKPGS